MKSHSLSAVRASVVFAIALFLVYPRLAPARQPAAAPAELVRLMERATLAVNGKKAEDLAPFTTDNPKRLLPWLTETTTPKWEGSVLSLPISIETQPSKIENSSGFLAVFHAWHTCESDGDHVHWMEKTGRGWRIGKEIPETETGGFRVRDHQAQVRIEPARRSAIITDSVRIERTADERPSFGLLRLSQDFRVSQVTRDGENGKAVPFRQAGGIIAFAPPAEKSFTLTLKYAGVVNHRGSDFILSDEATLNSYWLPHIARLPATATITATVPLDWTPITIGERISKTQTSGTTHTVTFRNDLPVCFYTLTAGKYVITTRKQGSHTLATYLRTANPQLAAKSLDRLETAMAFFEKRFGPFPYSGYTLVETKGPFGGALESYSFATFGPATLPGVIAHELAHSWWGGVVPCTYTQSMWSESFSEYADALLQRVIEGSDASKRFSLEERQRSLRRNASAYNAVPMTQAFDTSDGRQSAVGYGKGALVLRVLEEEIGQETVVRCMREFAASHKKGEAAEWPDFEAVVNKITGKDYRWFFAQWAERTGMPMAHLARVTIRNSGGGYVVEADVVQPGVPYRLKMPVVLEMANGEVVRETFVVQGPRTPIRLRAPVRPYRLILDPEGILPLAQPPNVPDETDRTLFTFFSGTE